MSPLERSPTVLSPLSFITAAADPATLGCDDEVPLPPPALPGSAEDNHDTKSASAIMTMELLALPRPLSLESKLSSPLAGEAQRQRQRCLRTVTKGALEAGAAVADVLAPPSCLPFLSSLRPKPREAPYQHVKLRLDRIRPYLEQHGAHGMAYGHLHKAQFQFEVRTVFLNWVFGWDGWIGVGAGPVPYVSPIIHSLLPCFIVSTLNRCPASASSPTAGSAASLGAPPL